MLEEKSHSPGFKKTVGEEGITLQQDGGKPPHNSQKQSQHWCKDQFLKGFWEKEVWPPFFTRFETQWDFGILVPFWSKKACSTSHPKYRKPLNEKLKASMGRNWTQKWCVPRAPQVLPRP